MSVLTQLLASESVRSFDTKFDRLAARFRGSQTADSAMYAVSQIANHSVLWHSIDLIDAAIGGPKHRQAALRRSIILLVEQGIVNGPIKMAVRRDRPVDSGSHPHRLRRPRTSSFPSGHASAATCAATLLTRDLGYGPLWWSAAVAVSWSRVHVGVHHASDVVAGVVIGAALANAAVRLWPVDGPPEEPAPCTGRSGRLTRS